MRRIEAHLDEFRPDRSLRLFLIPIDDETHIVGWTHLTEIQRGYAEHRLDGDAPLLSTTIPSPPGIVRNHLSALTLAPPQGKLIESACNTAF